MDAFQRAQGLSTGGLTLTTVDALGVNWRALVGGSSGSYSGSYTTGQASIGSSVTTLSGSVINYTVTADGQVLNAEGLVIGRLDGQGNVVNEQGVIIIRNIQTNTVTETTVRNYTISADGRVLDENGAYIGILDGNGNVVDGSGNIIIQGITTSSSYSTSGGNVTRSGYTSYSSQTFNYTVNSDGSVIDTATGEVVGRVDRQGNIIDAAGNIIGQTAPLN